MYDAVIIGGGASGLAAAVKALKNGKKILVLEAEKRVGKKILLAGNGRCNLSNKHLSADCYNTPSVAEFLKYSGEVYDFFEEIGLKTRTLDGRIYPYSESGKSVLNLLREAVGESNILTEQTVKEISAEEEGFSVNGIKTNNVILCTGSSATTGRDCADLYKKFGHTAQKPSPVLVPLTTSTEFIKGLSGIRAKVRLSVKTSEKTLFSECGEILFKDNGVSGILAMDASRFLDGNCFLEIDFLPDIAKEEVLRYVKRGKTEGLVQRMIFLAVEKQSAFYGLPVEKVLKKFIIKNISPCNASQAQVMRGGLRLEEFDEKLQSKLKKGLYACGEVLNVDARCGGYNLHWAFLSGIIAGKSV